MEYTNVKGLVTGVSDIAFGTATSTLEDEAKIHDMLDYYVSIGGNYIDTSRFYGRGSGIQHTEELLGRWLAKGTIAARSSSRANAATRIWTTR